MKQPEARISTAIMAACRAKEWFCFKVHGSEYMMVGLPDIIVCAGGRFIGVETKLPATRNNVSNVQKLRHQQINDAGGFAFVACSANEAIRKIEEYLADLDDRIDGR
jgi:hypothetical protein